MTITTTPLRRYRITDEEPSGFNPVLLRQGESDDDASIVIEQADEFIHLGVEHAKAVHAALGEMLGSLD